MQLNKTFLLVLCLALVPQVFGAAALVANVSASGNGPTTANINTTGATLIVIGQSCLTGSACAGPPTDSKGNTYTSLTAQVSSLNAEQLYYVLNPVVGTGHNFTGNGSGGSGDLGICVMAFANITDFDKQNGSATASGTSLKTNSILPAVNNELIVSYFGVGGDVSLPTVDANMTRTDAFGFGSGVTLQQGCAYFVQNNSASINPNWTFATIVNTGAATVASFRSFVSPSESSLYNGQWGFPSHMASGSSTGFILNTSTDRYAIGFIPPRNISIFNISAISGSQVGTAVFRWGFQTGDGTPNGTYINGLNITGTSNNNWINKVLTINLTSGTRYWLVVEYDSGFLDQTNRSAIIEITEVTGTNYNGTSPFNEDWQRLGASQNDDGAWVNNTKDSPFLMFNGSDWLGYIYTSAQNRNLNTTVQAGQNFTMDRNINVTNISIQARFTASTCMLNMHVLNTSVINTTWVNNTIANCSVAVTSSTAAVKVCVLNQTVAFANRSRYGLVVNSNCTTASLVTLSNFLTVSGGFNPIANSTMFGPDSVFTTSDAWETITRNPREDLGLGFGVLTSSNSCTYGSGNWAILGSDNCVISTTVDVFKNNVTFTGGGTATITGSIINFTNMRIHGVNVTKRSP